jgi:hypothetical protein
MTQQLKLKFKTEPTLRPSETVKQLDLIVENKRVQLAQMVKDLPIAIGLDQETATDYPRYCLYIDTLKYGLKRLSPCESDFDVIESLVNIIRTLKASNLIDTTRTNKMRNLIRFIHCYLLHPGDGNRKFNALINKGDKYITSVIKHTQNHHTADGYGLYKLLVTTKTSAQAQAIIDVIADECKTFWLNRASNNRYCMRLYYRKPRFNFNERKQLRKDYIDKVGSMHGWYWYKVYNF